MKNIWLLFRNDLKRITGNVVTKVTLLGLILLPSIFSWYNVLACWDVFGNTDNLTVAVANTDEGYKSDLVPMKMNIGEQVVSSLRANDQMKWEFVSEEEAIEGTKSGEYYAAVVIPPSFSRDMMTFYSDNAEHAKIVYYANEKKNVIAPKLTDQGADRVSYQVNQIFMETLSEVALGMASSLNEYSDSAGVDSRLGDLADHMGELGGQMEQASQVVGSYSSMLDASRALVVSSSKLMEQTQASVDEVGSAVDESKKAISSISDAMGTSSDALGVALEKTAAGYEGVSESVDAAFSSTDQLAGTSVSSLRAQADAIDAQVAASEDLLAQIKKMQASVPEDYQPVVDSLITQLQSSIEMQKNLATSLRGAANDIESGNADAQATHAEVSKLAQEVSANVKALSESYNNDIKPRLEQLKSQISSLSATLESSAASLDGVAGDAAVSTSSLLESIDQSKKRLDAASADLKDSAARMGELSQAMSAALAADDIRQLRAVLSADPEALAAALAAPVQLDREAVFPAEDFGSQMAPLYTTLALWIGSLLLVVAIKVSVSRSQREELGNWKLYQLFLGRFGVFSLVSFCQTTVMALGNMFFLQIQANEPLLYLLCFWVAGQVFTLICYTLVVSFANLGKAIAVFILIIQVTAGNGSFPLPMLPDFFQILSPFLPATHVIGAMRAAMMGIYEADYWIEMGQLLLFVVPFLLLGLALRKPLMRFLNWYVDKVEESKLVS